MNITEINNKTRDLGLILTGGWADTADLVSIFDEVRETLLVAFLGNEALEDETMKNNELPTAVELSRMTYALHLLSNFLSHKCNDDEARQ